MRKFIIFFLTIFACVANSYARKGFDREIKNSLFVPKGTWASGLSFSYLEMEGDNYKFIILDDVLGEGYTFKISPHVSYFFKNNISAGFRAVYQRTYVDVNNINIDLGDDLNFEIKDYSYIDHGISATGFIRTYMGLGKSKIFGFFNELSLTYGYSQGKTVSGTGESLTGTYQTTNKFQIGATPGLTAFVTNNLAVEVSVDVLGLNFQWIDQKTNQVESGSFRKSSANFKIDIFSINIGLCTYF